MAQITPPKDQNSFLAGVGHICLQWALLEQTVLFIIGLAEHLPIDKVYTRYGSLDMLQRLNMAIRVTSEDKWPLRLTKPLVEIRKALQRGGGGLAEQRNLFVHGVHKLGPNEGEIDLTMARWSPDKRTTTVTIVEAVELTHKIALLAQKADAVFVGYGVWQFGPKSVADRNQNVAQTKAALRLIRAHNIKRALKLLWANLKPW